MIALIPKCLVGREGFEPSKLSQRIYSPSHLAALESPQKLFGIVYLDTSNHKHQKIEPLAGIEPATY